MSKQHKYLPEIIEKDESEIKGIIVAIRACSLSDEIKSFVIKCIELALWLPLFLQNKNISINRLRVMIFGKGYNRKNKNILPNPTTPPDEVPAVLPDSAISQSESALVLNEASTDSIDTTSNAPSTDIAPTEQKQKKPGHGRIPHTAYKNCTEIQLLLKNLIAGDDCPTSCGGKLSNYTAGVIIRIKGQNFAQAYRYFVEKLRCNLCGEIFSAEIPPEVGDKKYDESFIAMLALMKYYVGIPFYRQEHFQKILGFPLPDATQWDLMENLAGYCYAPFNSLKVYAANSTLIHNDDTTLRILDVIKQIKEGTAGDRTGMYTTGIVALYEGYKIALFINGRQHSGENVGDILKCRDPDKALITQMCDALSANIPKAIQTILCKCLSHGFRKFEELVGFVDDSCLEIMKQISKVFENDAQTRNMSDLDRLAYHQEYSQPVMDALEQYMKDLIDNRIVEPNSELGKSIKYMQNHWVGLTKFLTVPGAPIDNNIVERALKIAIRNRKAAFFYKSIYSANIGGMLTSLMYTCHLNNENPQHYLVALQLYQVHVTTNPDQWLPWNYRETMAKLGLVNDAKPQVPLLSSDPPVAA